jgi:hypothetical protein
MAGLGLMFKGLPSQYVFAGYNVKKGLSVMSHVENGKMLYDIFVTSYMEDKLSFYILMDDGKYKNMDTEEKVDEIKVEGLVSRHLYSGENYDLEDFDQYDKEKLAGVFGLRDMPQLMKDIDNLEEKLAINKLKAQAVHDVRKNYTGLEINTLINRWNSSFSKYKGYFSVPAITNGPEDTYQSAIGDEIEYFDLINEKSYDEIVELLRTINSGLDGLGNIK